MLKSQSQILKSINVSIKSNQSTPTKQSSHAQFWSGQFFKFFTMNCQEFFYYANLSNMQPNFYYIIWRILFSSHHSKLGLALSLCCFFFYFFKANWLKTKNLKDKTLVRGEVPRNSNSRPKSVQSWIFFTFFRLTIDLRRVWDFSRGFASHWGQEDISLAYKWE